MRVTSISHAYINCGLISLPNLRREMLVRIGNQIHDVPCAIELDSAWAMHRRNDRWCSSEFGYCREFSDRDFYKLGRQLAKM